MRFSATTMVMAVMTVAAFMMGTALLSTREHQAGSVNTYIAVHFIACSLFLSFSLFFSTSPFCISSLVFLSFICAFMWYFRNRGYLPPSRGCAARCLYVCGGSQHFEHPLCFRHIHRISQSVYSSDILYIFGSCRSRMLYQAIVTRRHYRTTLDSPLARALLATIVAFTARLWVRQPATSPHNTTSIYRYIYCQSIIKRRVRMYHS